MYKIMLLLIISIILTACGTGGDSTQEDTGYINGTSSGSGINDDENNSDNPLVREESKHIQEKSKEDTKKALEVKNTKEGELAGQITHEDERFIFIVTNQQEKAADIYFSTGQEYDYVVYDEFGKAVKMLSEGMMYTQAIKELTLEPGEHLEYPVNYDEVTADLSPGSYSIQFTFSDVNNHASAKETFTIE